MNMNYNTKKKTFRLVTVSLFCALSISISYVESLVMLPIFIPGVKPGFSNIITMFVSSCFGIIPALTIVIIKAIFVAMTKGFIAFLMSFFGGLFSTIITGVLIRRHLFCSNYIYIGLIGALFHNFTQIIVAFVIIGNIVFYYTPLLILFSIITGIITGAILKTIIPVLSEFFENNTNST